MRKITSTHDAIQEIRQILAYCESTQERPSRAILAAQLHSLAQRVAGDRVEDLAVRKIKRSPLWNTLSAEQQRKMLGFMKDPLYAAVFAAKNKADADEAFKNLQIRGISTMAELRRVLGL